MATARFCKTRGVALTLAIVFLSAGHLFGDSSKSQLVDRQLRSESIARNKIGSNPIRKMVIYLTPGSNETEKNGSQKRYPVIYFLPSPEGSYRAEFNQEGAQTIFDHTIATGVIDKFIFVSVDMNTPLRCSWYINSPVTGDWEDFMIRELIPYIDASLRTLPTKDARGISGEFMGGYGAIRFGMKHPDTFGSIYALGAVGTASGLNVLYGRPNWDLLANAKSLDELEKVGFWQNIFTTIFQAHLPDLSKPPLFIDLYVQKTGEQWVDSELSRRLQNNFLLETMIPHYAENLKSLRDFKIDWERNDRNPDHVYANQAFTRKLDEFGISHEAEDTASMGTWSLVGRRPHFR